MTVRSLARTDVVTVSKDATVTEIARTMADHGVGSVVVTTDEVPVGIVTDRDLALDVLGTGEDPETVLAEEIMTEDLFTVDADAGVFEVIAKMCEAGVRRVPLVDGGDLAGIVTLDDFVVLLAGELDNLAGVVEAESPPYPEPTA